MKATSGREVKRIRPDEVKAMIDAGEPILFLDTRNPTAWGESDSKLPGAMRMPADQVDTLADKIPSDRKIVSYCT